MRWKTFQRPPPVPSPNASCILISIEKMYNCRFFQKFKWFYFMPRIFPNYYNTGLYDIFSANKQQTSRTVGLLWIETPSAVKLSTPKVVLQCRNVCTGIIPAFNINGGLQRWHLCQILVVHFVLCLSCFNGDCQTSVEDKQKCMQASPPTGENKNTKRYGFQMEGLWNGETQIFPLWEFP